MCDLFGGVCKRYVVCPHRELYLFNTFSSRLVGGSPQLLVQFPQWFVILCQNLGSVSLHLCLQLAYHLGCSVEGAALSMLADPYPYQFFAVVPYSLPHSTSHRNVTYNMQWKVTGISSRPKLIESIIIARFVESTVMELAAIYSDYI